MLKVLTETAGRVIDEHDARDGLGCLHRLSLITLSPDSPSRAVRVHALVQRATRDDLPDERTAVVVRAAAEAMLQVWPDREGHTGLAQVLLAITNPGHLWATDARRVLRFAAESLGRAGQPVAAYHQFMGLLDDYLVSRPTPS
ncbi:hypothetical protein PV646_30990 [Streptomyces sp. ID05-26A]|nr:hypothetical protein [Streptomyces sp. ID05-26A]